MMSGITIVPATITIPMNPGHSASSSHPNPKNAEEIANATKLFFHNPP